MEVHGYGADVALEGQALTLTATGKIGRGALGTDRREIAIDHLRAVDFQHANPIRNGRLTLVDGVARASCTSGARATTRWSSSTTRSASSCPRACSRLDRGRAAVQ